MACISRSGLHRFPTLRHLHRHVGAPDLAGQPQFFGEAPHELRVFRRCAPAQAMVEMTNHQIPKTRHDQHVEQRHRIRTTRNADQPALPVRSTGKPWGIGNNRHGHKLIRPKDSRNFYRLTPRKQASAIGITRGRSGRGSSPCSRPPRNRGQTWSASPRCRRLLPRREAGNWNRRPDRHVCRST